MEWRASHLTRCLQHSSIRISQEKNPKLLDLGILSAFEIIKAIIFGKRRKKVRKIFTLSFVLALAPVERRAWAISDLPLLAA